MADAGAAIDIAGLACPTPVPERERVMLGHGGGGALSQELIERVFLPAFANPVLDSRGDAGVLEAADLLAGGRLAVCTDSYVVRPRIFPGGTIGDLAVNGTVNDLAMSGARPLWLTAGFIVEEGFSVGELTDIAGCMARAARAAGVVIVAGDTKVVERGRGDGCYVNTSGIGVVPPGVALGPERIRPGDAVLVSGTLADHGMAVMSVREGLEFDSPIASDTAPLHGLVAAMLAACADVRMLRDPTRGGAATSLVEIATLARVGIEIEEESIPVAPPVAAACELLGIDPLAVANEGKLLAVVPEAHAEAVLAAMRCHDRGRDAVRIGRVVATHPGLVAMRTALGGTRIVPMPIGEQLPRIC
jgi:hydrogenase expression/formation protein HypE